jgi:hypothetical protein
MADRRRKVVAVALVALLLVAGAAAVLVVTGWGLPAGTSCPAIRSSPAPGPTNLTVPIGPFSLGGLHYDAAELNVPFTAPNTTGTPTRNATVDGVTVQLWVISPRSWGMLLEGWAQGSDGVPAWFIVSPNSTDLADQTNASAQSFLAPSGLFGIRWIGDGGGAAQVEVAIADPAPAFHVVDPPPPTGGACSSVAVDGVRFAMQESSWNGGTPAGGADLRVFATFPNGSQFETDLDFGGPRLVCTLGAPASAGPPPGHFCVGWSAPGYAAVVQVGGTGIALEVRTA